jgi:hypothetical protein
MVDHFAGKQVPWGPVGYLVYKRTYSRVREDLGRQEEWYETLHRCIDGLLDIGGLFTEDEVFRLYGHCFNLRGSFSGRALWQLGTQNMYRIGADSLQNCWAVAVNDPIDPFCFTFNQLMLGGGVGFNILPENVYSLPTVAFDPKVEHVDTYDCTFVVPDNREGWVKLLGRVLKSFFYTGKDISYCTKGVRSKGSLISTFGGKASGDADLIWGIEQIAKILRSRIGKKLRPIDCLDIQNIIGTIVVAGNVRRSAELALGDPADLEYMAAKNWSLGSLPAWREKSNNSVYANCYEVLPDSFWNGYNGEGEAYGMVNLDLCRRYGRLADGLDYRPDPLVIGTNPCGEITLANKEACNLTELFACRVKDLDTFKDVAYLNYKIAKTISKWPFSDPDTNDIVSHHHRLGCGVTGVQQATWWGPRDYDAVYRYLEEADIHYSKVLGVKRSIKLTTVKPSGTLSLLADYLGGVLTPGTNDGYAPFHIRRVRLASDDALVEVCRDHGYHVEPARRIDGGTDLQTMVVSFPVKQVGGRQTSAIHQLKRHKLMQTYWADNSVSTTVYYRPEELDDIKAYLKRQLPKSIKSVSFLLHTDHGFDQAPLEAITEDQYREMTSKTRPITSVDGTDLLDSFECVSGACPTK